MISTKGRVFTKYISMEGSFYFYCLKDISFTDPFKGMYACISCPILLRNAVPAKGIITRNIVPIRGILLRNIVLNKGKGFTDEWEHTVKILVKCSPPHPVVTFATFQTRSMSSYLVCYLISIGSQSKSLITVHELLHASTTDLKGCSQTNFNYLKKIYIKPG